MKIGLVTLTIAAASLFAAIPAAAQTVGCACAAAYEVGDRVVALVNDPSAATGLPAGTMGTVVCGLNPPQGGLEILVRWDGFANGSEFNVDSCSCPGPAPGTGTPADWYVACSEIALTRVTNITQGTGHITIADGVASANSGDVLELDGYTFVERGIVLNNFDLTIRGQGIGLSIIDGDNVAGTIFEVRNGADLTLERMTIRNGLATTSNGGAAVFVNGAASSGTIRDCELTGHDSNGSSFGAVQVTNDAMLLVERCVFSQNATPGNGNASDVASVFGAHATIVQSEFSRPVGSRGRVYAQSDASVLAVNCTFAAGSGSHHVRAAASGATADLVGCVFDDSTSQGTFLGFNGGVVTATRCVYPGATGDNIDGVPTFVDAFNADYRLVPGSLGIDGADIDAFIAAGGGLLDLAGVGRLVDDPGTADSGAGTPAWLDCGAYEFQGISPVPGACAGDLDNDGDTDLTDFTILATDFGCAPTP
jgi:hypothetical protein